MAAAIVTTSTTLEGQLWEVAQRLQIAELAQPIETRINNTSVVIDTDAQTLSVTYTGEATFSLDASGKLVIAPTPYLP